MWRFKQFMPKEHAGLEGRTIDVGNIKVHVRDVIAEGGFSCVYSARDLVDSSKQYALKHVIIQDGESMGLVMKEISVMKSLKGHPNVVTLIAHAILDMGRTKEALLLMEFCEKSLVTVLESRGAGYFEEKQIFLIFRDVCNAVFAMHCQSPPIAHRDLKAENVLLGADGAWKLCDFGSTSTNHKCFDKPEEMGIEEDNIRKHTTPAYRAPEMWDLYRKEFISEKVDIWALGCLLFRICYLKLAFDGESKLQILNGNYRIPELPKYSSSIMNLIKDMLESSPDSRPDITQVWFRVNELLPVELQRNLPDGSPSASAFDMHPAKSDVQDEGVNKKTSLAPRRSPPPLPMQDHLTSVSPPKIRYTRSSHSTSKVEEGGAPLGAFWSTQHAQDSLIVEDKGPVFDNEPINQMTSKHTHKSKQNRISPPRERPAQGNIRGNSFEGFSGSSTDFEIRFSPNGSEHGPKPINPEGKAFSQKTFNTFVAEFDTSKIGSGSNVGNMIKANKLREEELEAEVHRLKEELKLANLEKEEIASKYEKLSSICSSQRQELQDLKCALAAATTPLSSKDISKTETSSASSQSITPRREKIEGTLQELQQGLFTTSPATPSPDPKPWAAFVDEPKVQTTTKSTHPRSVRTVRTTNNNKSSTAQSSTRSTTESWGFEQDSFKAFPSGSEIAKATDPRSTSLRFADGRNETKKMGSNQPAGWAGF